MPRAIARTLEAKTPLDFLGCDHEFDGGTNELGWEAAVGLLNWANAHPAREVFVDDRARVAQLACAVRGDPSMTHLDLTDTRVLVNERDLELELSLLADKHVDNDDSHLIAPSARREQRRPSSEDVKWLARLVENSTTLREITLCRSGFGAKGLAAIELALAKNTTLLGISLESNNLGEDGGAAIWQALVKNTGLQKIRLSDNDLGADSGATIGRALKTNTVELANTLLGAADAAVITLALQKNTTLQEINLACDELGWEAAVGLLNWAEAQPDRSVIIEDQERMVRLARAARFHHATNGQMMHCELHELSGTYSSK